MNKKRILTIIGKLLLTIFLIAAFLGLIFLFLHFTLNINYSDLKNKKTVQEMVAKSGAFAPLLFILISFLQVTFIPIPGSVTILAGNYLFGFWESLFYSYIGMLIGSLLAFYLGRVIGRPFVNWIVGDVETVDDYLKRLDGKETVLLFFMFFLPFFPDDLLCSVAGITKITWFKFIVMQIITRFTSIVGTLIFMSGDIIPYNSWGIPLIILFCIFAIIAFIISYKKADKINRFMDNLAEKIIKK